MWIITWYKTLPQIWFMGALRNPSAPIPHDSLHHYAIIDFSWGVLRTIETWVHLRKVNNCFINNNIGAATTSRIIREKGYQINQKRFFLVKSPLRHLIFFLFWRGQFFFNWFRFCLADRTLYFQGKLSVWKFQGKIRRRSANIVIYYYSLSLACALTNSLLYPLV
jgi:hypothetical protein